MAEDFGALYEALGVTFVSTSGDNRSALCPLHDDNSSSFSVNVSTGVYKCFAPGCPAYKGGSYVSFHRLKTGEPPSIPMGVAERYHEALLDNSTALKWLREMRGLSEETIRKFKLGWNQERLTIPIIIGGKCVNIRRHSPKKSAKIPKTIPYEPGYGSLRLFPEPNLIHDEIVLCEGELDALLLCQLGFHAVTATGGAGSWNDEWNNLFKGKIVHILYDIDNAGRIGAELVAGHLSKTALTVKNILLPISSPPNGDVTDYVVTYNAGRQELEKLFRDSAPWQERKESPATAAPSLEAVDVEFSEASQARWVGQQVRFKSTVAGKDLAPYACPAKVNFTCQMGLKICNFCSIGQNQGKLNYDVPGHGLEVLRLINCTEDQQRQFLKKAAGVYPSCPRFNMEATAFHTVEDVRMIPEISFSNMQTSEYVVRQGYHIGHGLVPNTTYEFEGTVVPNPKNQYITFVLPKSKPVKDSVTAFKLTADDIEQLKIFQSADVEAQMYKIASDLTANVTKIYQREDLVVLLDLIFHSVLQFEFQDRMVRKGWTEGLVLGDTRCGKTETGTSLIEHYKAGEICTGENASFAGLLGGMQQVGSRWSIIWGKWPLNDRRFLLIDEVSGMPVEDIGKMSGVRSSGIAEITKVQQEKTFARTRSVWMGNARSSRSLSTYDHGVLAIRELIGRPEDIARFDLCMTVASGEVDIDVINQQRHNAVPHVFTSELCHKLVLWAWSRKPGDVKFTKEAEKECLNEASKLSKEFSAVIPLIEPAEQRIKLARLSVACAARLFSTESGEEVVVLPSHVRFVAAYLRKIFNRPSMGYGAFSRAQMAELRLKDETAVRGVLQPYGLELVEALLDRQYLRGLDLEDILDKSKAEVRPIIAKLVQNRALKHTHNAYVKSPAFIEFLKKAQEKKSLGEPVLVKEEF